MKVARQGEGPMMPPTQDRARGPSLRRRFNGFFERHEMAWELWMGFLALAFICITLLEDNTLAPGVLGLLDIVDKFIYGFFVLEFVSRLSFAPSRLSYLKGHWIDILALIPETRYFRLGRLARLLRLLASFDRVMCHAKGISTQNGLHYFAVAIIGLMVGAAGVLHWAEFGINDNIHSFEDALWWSAVTLSTVGYGDVYPVTGIGRAAAVVIMFGGVLLWGMIAASIATYFMSERKPENAVLEVLKTQLDRIHEASIEELRTLKLALDGVLDHEIGKRADELRERGQQ